MSQPLPLQNRLSVGRLGLVQLTFVAVEVGQFALHHVHPVPIAELRETRPQGREPRAGFGMFPTKVAVMAMPRSAIVEAQRSPLSWTRAAPSSAC